MEEGGAEGKVRGSGLLQDILERREGGKVVDEDREDTSGMETGV